MTKRAKPLVEALFLLLKVSCFAKEALRPNSQDYGHRCENDE
jgi:hypothetical protein